MSDSASNQIDASKSIELQICDVFIGVPGLFRSRRSSVSTLKLKVLN
jgi:hypothetical protein